MAWSPLQADLVATGGSDDRAYIWRVGQEAFEETGGAVLELTGHTDTVSALAFSADGSSLASGGMDGCVRVWEVASGRCIQALEGPGDAVEWLSWHPKGNVLLAGAADFTAWMWLAQTGACMQVRCRGLTACYSARTLQLRWPTLALSLAGVLRAQRACDLRRIHARRQGSGDGRRRGRCVAAGVEPQDGGLHGGGAGAPLPRGWADQPAHPPRLDRSHQRLGGRCSAGGAAAAVRQGHPQRCSPWLVRNLVGAWPKAPAGCHVHSTPLSVVPACRW